MLKSFTLFVSHDGAVYFFSIDHCQLKDIPQGFVPVTHSYGVLETREEIVAFFYPNCFELPNPNAGYQPAYSD